MIKVFKTCPLCGANLDPCEVCDCLTASNTGTSLKRQNEQFKGNENKKEKKNEL